MRRSGVLTRLSYALIHERQKTRHSPGHAHGWALCRSTAPAIDAALQAQKVPLQAHRISLSAPVLDVHYNSILLLLPTNSLTRLHTGPGCSSSPSPTLSRSCAFSSFCCCSSRSSWSCSTDCRSTPNELMIESVPSVACVRACVPIQHCASSRTS